MRLAGIWWRRLQSSLSFVDDTNLGGGLEKTAREALIGEVGAAHLSAFAIPHCEMSVGFFVND
jgi:hypothetical protein